MAPTTAPSDVLLRGRQLAHQGDKERRLPACASCHGATLTGVAPNVLFLGTNFEVNVRVGGLNVIASVPAAREGGFRAGQPVRLRLDLTNARVFND